MTPKQHSLSVDNTESSRHPAFNAPYGLMLSVQLRRAAQCIQRLQRGRSVRMAIQKQAAAVTVLQKCWRAHTQRRAYLGMLAAAVKLQAAVRCWRLRQGFWRMRAAASTIQVACKSRPLYLITLSWTLLGDGCNCVRALLAYICVHSAR